MIDPVVIVDTGPPVAVEIFTPDPGAINVIAPPAITVQPIENGVTIVEVQVPTPGDVEIIELPNVTVTVNVELPTVEVTELAPVVVQPIEAANSTIVEVQVPGPVGPSGETIAKTFTAFETLSGHMAVIGHGSFSVAKASNNNPAHIGLVCGITTNAAIVDDPINVVSSGWIDEPSFAFVPGPVYLGVNGGLTQVPPSVGFLQQIATAVDTTRICVNIRSPINLT